MVNVRWSLDPDLTFWREAMQHTRLNTETARSDREKISCIRKTPDDSPPFIQPLISAPYQPPLQGFAKIHPEEKDKAGKTPFPPEKPVVSSIPMVPDIRWDPGHRRP